MQLQEKEEQLANANAVIHQLQQDLIQAHNALINEVIAPQPQENPVVVELEEEEEEDPEEIMDVDSVIDSTEILGPKDKESDVESSESQEVTSAFRREK